MTRIFATLIAAAFASALVGASLAEQSGTAPATEQTMTKEKGKALTKEERAKQKEERAAEKARTKEERAKEKARKTEERAKMKAEKKSNRAACQEQAKLQKLRGQERKDFVAKCTGKA